MVGNFKNNGREWRRQARPELVNIQAFIDPKLSRAVPYRMYDITNNVGWVSVGTDHDTASFAVNAIRRWWRTMGTKRHPTAKRPMITADGGGSNGSRVRLWQVELQKLADELKLPIRVCHLPPGTSKWNKIKHRLFSFITINWRGKPLRSYRTIVQLIAVTTTDAGFKARSELDERKYLADWGYLYPTDDLGKSQRTSLQGPEYMRLMRKRTKQAGVTILNHSPALELLVDDNGAVAGASGLRRRKHDRWTVRAEAVVIATGGCALLSKIPGSNVLTGDGYLMTAQVERMMQRHGICAIMAPPRRVRTTDSRHDLPIAPNLIARDVTADAPNRVWLADITYIPTAEGWLYLAAVMDLFGRTIVGWAMRDHMQVELASAALTMATQQQRPQAGFDPSLRSRHPRRSQTVVATIGGWRLR
ncbi:hypothetical protein ABIB80_006680 [Bradyrhizobium sp. i1.15.2]